MPKALPPQPNIDWLKKAAKELVVLVQRVDVLHEDGDPGARIDFQ
jgi:hypothetical protein